MATPHANPEAVSAALSNEQAERVWHALHAARIGRFYREITGTSQTEEEQLYSALTARFLKAEQRRAEAGAPAVVK
jgi:hemerythrin superfamily protein